MPGQLLPVSRRGDPAASQPLPMTARTVLVAVWIGVAAVHAALAPGGRMAVWPLSYALLELLATASLARRAWAEPGPSRPAWWLLAASTALEVPNLAITHALSRGWDVPRAAGLPGLLSLATGILVLAGVLAFPRAQESRGFLWRRLQDGLIFAVAVLFLLWVLGVQGSLRAADRGMGFRVFVAYLNAALLGGGIVFMTSYDPGRIRGPLGWLGASALAWLAALSCWALAGLPSVVATQGWIVLAGAIPLFQGLAAWSPRPVEEALAAPGSERRAVRLLPYLPVAIAIGVLAGLLALAPGNATRGAFAIFLAMVALLLLRQFQSIQDLQAARRTLEDRVRHRTRALEQAQATLLRTERMNTVALMGAGLAHDLNNLLCSVKSSAELAVLKLGEGGHPGPEELHRIAGAADRAARLTSRLMGFVRREEEDLSSLDLGAAVKGLETTLRLILPRSVELRIDAADGTGLVVQSSRLRVEQMVVNLVANARDAMPDGGVLTVRAGVGMEDRPMVMLEVADTGIGMTPETLDCIFDPFFTTKAPGKGTGIGLPSLKALVEEDGGRMEVTSELGRGSRFSIFLPRVSVA
ncbi:sensor histidine kinase [Geothrix fermentans]|uniref:sensor histidine kinase n=1 Tax=Geothrix fermentans TaxID=44676 RepID=UPI00047CA1B5|nr:HAMP domain-containing sensor histidine kinase [Geothrix fermentans]